MRKRPEIRRTLVIASIAACRKASGRSAGRRARSASAIIIVITADKGCRTQMVNGKRCLTAQRRHWRKFELFLHTPWGNVLVGTGRRAICAYSRRFLQGSPLLSDITRWALGVPGDEIGDANGAAGHPDHGAEIWLATSPRFSKPSRASQKGSKIASPL